MKKVYCIIRTNIFEFEVYTDVEVYSDKASAKKRLNELADSIREDAVSRFGEEHISEDSELIDGGCTIDKSETCYDAYQSGEASIWSESVRLVEKDVESESAKDKAERLIETYGQNGELDVFNISADEGVELNDSTIDGFTFDGSGNLIFYYNINTNDYEYASNLNEEDVCRFLDTIEKFLYVEDALSQNTHQ